MSETIIYAVASAILVVASLLDGASTVHFLKNPQYHEINPLFGPHPSTARIFGQGMAIIAGEIAFGATLGHYHHWTFPFFIAGWFVQSAIHFYWAQKNFQVPVK